MKTRTILFLSVVIPLTVAAQSRKADTDSLIFRKNELSINTAPVFRVLMNSSSADATRFSITYKRNLNEKSALRLSLMADRHDPQNAQSIGIVLDGDTTMERTDVYFPPYVFTHVNLGYERLFGKGKLKWFYGADLAVGATKIKTRTYKKTVDADSTYLVGFVMMNDSKGDLVSTTETQVLSIGISPFFGIKYPISKRFSVSLQVGADMAYKSNDFAETKQSGTTKLRSSSFDFDQKTGILNDISLVYRF